MCFGILFCVAGGGDSGGRSSRAGFDTDPSPMRLLARVQLYPTLARKEVLPRSPAQHHADEPGMASRTEAHGAGGVPESWLAFSLRGGQPTF